MANETKTLEFENPELNKKYQILARSNHQLITPDGYSGTITGISREAVLEGLIKRGSNLVARKAAATGK